MGTISSVYRNNKLAPDLPLFFEYLYGGHPVGGCAANSQLDEIFAFYQACLECCLPRFLCCCGGDLWWV